MLAALRRAAGLAVLLLVVLGAAPAAAQAAEDQIVIKGDVAVPPGRVVGDVVVVDGDATIAGRTTGDVVVVSGDARVLGRIQGDLVTVSGRATLGPAARVGGDLHYGDERPRLARGAQVAGSIDHERYNDLSFGIVGRLILWLAFTVSALVLGLALLAFAPRAADAAFRAFRQAIGPAVGWGVAVMIGVPVVAVLLLVTLVGIPIGIALLLALLPLLAVGYVTGAWIVGRMLLAAPRSRFLAFLAGLGIVRVLALVPWLGGVVWLATTIVGLGALAVAAWRGGRARGPAPPPEVAVPGAR